MHVGDTAFALENPGALELDLLGGKALEQTSPLAEEHRDDVELELVENAGGECELCGARRRGPTRSCRPPPALACVIALATSSTYVTSGHSLTSMPGSWRL